MVRIILKKRSDSPFRKRPTKARWLVPLALITILGLFTCRTYFLNDDEIAREPITLETWSRFSETKRLDMLLQGFAISSIADIPCTGVEHFDLRALPVNHYLGIVEDRDAAGALQTRFGTEKSSFMALHPVLDVLPKVDLILCWDYLCTLSPLEIQTALLHFKKSGAKFILMRHFPQLRKNEEKKPGVLQPINWKQPPYNFPEPIIHIMEKGEHGMEGLALWDLGGIQASYDI